MDFYLSFNNKEDELRLPVIPTSFEISIDNNNQIVNIQNIGNINLIGKTGLAKISISSFFPSIEYSFCKYTGFPTPTECINLIKKWQISTKPIRLIITETPINLAMSIDNFKYGISDGTKDVDFTLDLTEYKFLKTSDNSNITTKNNNSIEKPKNLTREVKDTKTTYTVKAGDTLWGIAKKMTGNGSNYKTIASFNKIKDPDKIYVGQVIKI